MLAETFSTHSLPASQQLEAWRNWYGAIFEATSAASQDEGFAAANSNWKLNGFTFSRVSSPPTCIDRTTTPVAPQSRGSLGVHRQQAHDQRCRSARPRAGSTSRGALPALAGRGDAYRSSPAGRAGSAPSVARQFPGDCALAGRNAGDGPEHVAGQAARRLHSAARAQSSQSDARGRIAASERNPGHGWRLPRAVGRSVGGRRAPDRSHADGESAASGAQEPALALARAGQALPRGSHVALTALSSAGRRRRRGPLHPAPATLRELCHPVRHARTISRSPRLPRLCVSPMRPISAARSGGNSA